MAKIEISVDSRSLLKEVEELESKLKVIDKKITSELTMFVLNDIKDFIPVDEAKTQQSMYRYTLFAEGLIQWVRKHNKYGYDVVHWIYERHPDKAYWVDTWIDSGGLIRTNNKFKELLEDYL